MATSPNLLIQAERVLSSSPVNYPLLLDDSESEISSDQEPHRLSHSSYFSPSRKANPPPLLPLVPSSCPEPPVMAELKMIEFGGASSENIEHFLYGFEIYFQRKESRTPGDANRAQESSEAKAYHVIQHIKPGSLAFKFVNRLPLTVTRDYVSLCRELRSRFENSTEFEDEKRRAEESFLSLRQRSTQSIRGYIKLTRKIASRMSTENQHLVATQFIKGLDSRELRIQAMSGLSNRPTVEEVVTKVQRLWDVMGEEKSSEDEDDLELTDSDTDDDEEEQGGRSKGRRAREEKKARKERRKKRDERKTMKEAGNIRKELEELKQMLTKHQNSSYRLEGIPKPISVPDNADLPTIEAYAMGNRLVPPASYTGEPPARVGNQQYFQRREIRHQPWEDRFNTERDNGPQWGPTRQSSGQWQDRRDYEAYSGFNNYGRHPGFGPYQSGNRTQTTYPRRDRSQLVCYQCGIVGHLRYECHLLPRHEPGQDLPRREETNPYSAVQYRQAEDRQNIGKEETAGRQERLPCGARISTKGDSGVHHSSAVNGMVVEVVHQPTSNVTESDSDTSHKGNSMTELLTIKDSSNVAPPNGRFLTEVMAGERARLRSELTESSESQKEQPPTRRLRSQVEQENTNQHREQKRLPARRSGHQPIRLMAGRPGFDFVSGFRDTEVTGLTWGQFFDLSPEGKRQFVKLMVQERPKRKGLASKGKSKVEARVVESILSEAALVGKRDPNFEVTNFYTTAQICIGDRAFVIDHVLIDAGSVVNLAPISILRGMGASLQPTKDLVIRTAASNLVPLDFYADLKVEVASVITSIRVFAMPETCEPTYGLLLSRRWLRVCQAVGDYAEDAYVIKDSLGRDHKVPREERRARNGERLKVCLRPGGTGGRLEADLIAELELDEHKSFTELVHQIVTEAKHELAVFKALEDYSKSYDYAKSEELTRRGDTEGSETGYESDASLEPSEAEEMRSKVEENRKEREETWQGQFPTARSKN